MACDKLFMAPFIPTIARIVRNYTLYPKYERHINYLFHLIEQGRTWNSRMDMKARWDIVPPKSEEKERKALTQNKVSMVDIWGKMAEEVGLPETKETGDIVTTRKIVVPDTPQEFVKMAAEIHKKMAERKRTTTGISPAKAKTRSGSPYAQVFMNKDGLPTVGTIGEELGGIVPARPGNRPLREWPVMPNIKELSKAVDDWAAPDDWVVAKHPAGIYKVTEDFKPKEPKLRNGDDDDNVQS
jgi:hypothetical protein